jgi:hypothetical protein
LDQNLIASFRNSPQFMQAASHQKELDGIGKAEAGKAVFTKSLTSTGGMSPKGASFNAGSGAFTRSFKTLV